METTAKLTFRRFEDGSHDWQEWPELIFQAGHSHKCPTYQKSTPPCQAACPSGEDIRGWLAIARGTEKPPAGMPWQEYAWRRLTEANPFPAVMGRVCPAPCETACNRNALEELVGINSVEQFLGDWANARQLKFANSAASSGKKVAVIGGGVAGLSCAYQLALKGHAATIFDEHAELGGMMRYGIPGFRVPREVLDAEIGRILELGVNVRLGTRAVLDDVSKDFDAVFVGIGAQDGRPLPVPGGDAPNCVAATAFLRDFNEGRLKRVGKRVVVVGGGDTSIDVATVSRRLGAGAGAAADITLTSVFTIDKMQANKHEIEHALAEGIAIRDGWAPVEVVKGTDGQATGLKIARCEARFVGPKLEIKLQPGTEEIVPADLIVSAIGQAVDLRGLEGFDKARNTFAGGDIIRPHLLTTAIGHGWVAAERIDRVLRGEPLDKRPKIDVHAFDLQRKLRERGLPADAIHNYDDRAARYVIKADELFLGHFTHTPRNARKVAQLAAEQALGNFSERMQGLSEKEAVAEAKRCMSCGLCFECDNCVVFCPQTAVFRVKKAGATTGRYVDTDYTKCIGCHICADVCPTGYIQMGMGE